MLLLALAAVLDPLAFFAGHTVGAGRLRVILHRSRAVRVAGTGEPSAEGLTLTQRVEQDGRPATVRRWCLRRVAPGRYAGTLSDARGPVIAEARGPDLHIAYRTPGRVRIEQWLTLAADGRSASNRLVARRLGMVVARLDETIRKID